MLLKAGIFLTIESGYPGPLEYMMWIVYSPGNSCISYQGTFEDDFPFPNVGYVNAMEGNII